jgi:hypothetical protein
MPGDELGDSTKTIKPPAPSMASKIEPDKIAGLIATKQTQFYTLWVVFAAVQIALAGFGLGQSAVFGPYTVVALMGGFWAFNIGHLAFVLECQVQTDSLRAALRIALAEGMDSKKYDGAIRFALLDVQEARVFWRPPPEPTDREIYFRNILVHLFIDACASAAFLLRVMSI